MVMKWIESRRSLMIWSVVFMFLCGYSLLASQDSTEELASLYPRFVVARTASFDFFGESEIEVIIEDAEARPPEGSDQPINVEDVVDVYESISKKDINSLPSASGSEEEYRMNPETRNIEGSSRFLEGDRRATEERIRSFTKNSTPRAIPPSEVTDRVIVPIDSFPSIEEEPINRHGPDGVVIINVTPVLEPIISNIVGVTPVVENAHSHPWVDLPLADQQYLVVYFSPHLTNGVYIQSFATVQPLSLRKEIERYEQILPLTITTTSGRLGLMNRLLVGPLKIDELGAAESLLRLRGVHDYFLVVVRDSK